MRAERRRSSVTALVLATAACAPGAPSSSTPSPGTPPATTAMARAIAGLANTERTRAGRTPLQAEPARLGRRRFTRTRWRRRPPRAHDLPGSAYPALQDCFSAVGYEWQAIGENPAFGQPTAAVVVADWMGSAAHRDNILNAAFADTGIGYANDARGRTYFAQVFARPR